MKKCNDHHVIFYAFRRNTPNHNIINPFRSKRLKGILQQIFAQVVQSLEGEGLLNIKELYVDVTKPKATTRLK